MNSFSERVRTSEPSAISTRPRSLFRDEIVTFRPYLFSSWTRIIATAQAARPLRKSVGLKRNCSLNLRVKCGRDWYPNSAAIAFMGISVVVNRSAAINNRFFFEYSLTPNPVQRLKSRAAYAPEISSLNSRQAWSRSQPMLPSWLSMKCNNFIILRSTLSCSFRGCGNRRRRTSLKAPWYCTAGDS